MEAATWMPLATKPEILFRPCGQTRDGLVTSVLGHSWTLDRECGVSALPPEADMLSVGFNVC